MTNESNQATPDAAQSSDPESAVSVAEQPKPQDTTAETAVDEAAVVRWRTGASPSR